MKKTIILILACLAACQVFAQPTATVITDKIPSKILGVERECTVLLPARYNENPDKKYPVLYLLHGMYGNHTDWVREAGLKLEAQRIFDEWRATEMIIVTPNAGGFNPETEQNGYFNIPGWSYEDFFFQELIPTIESKYRIIGDRAHRAISGLSMGGGGTTSYAQRHPDMFCAAYAISAWVALTTDEADTSKVRPGRGGKIIPLERSVAEHDCIKYVLNANEEQLAAMKTVRWFLDCGDEDFLFDVNIHLYQAMRDRGIPCQLRVRDGGHTWEYWHTALSTVLPFVSMAFYEEVSK